MHRKTNRKKTSGLPPFVEDALTAIAAQPEEDFIGGFTISSAMAYLEDQPPSLEIGLAFLILQAALLDLDLPIDPPRLPWIRDRIEKWGDLARRKKLSDKLRDRLFEEIEDYLCSTDASAFGFGPNPFAALSR